MKTIKVMVIMLMLVFSLVPTMNLVSAAGPNFMGFTEPKKDVTVADAFYSYIYGDIHSAIDTIAVDNLTYLPTGVITNTLLSVANSKGDIFDDTYTLVFARATTVHDNLGWAKNWVWAIDAPGSTPRVNNVNATAFNTRWYAYSCGIATLTITAGGTAAGGVDPGTTKYTQMVYVHPMATTDFDAEPHNTTVLTMDWTKHTGDDKSVIRYKPGSNPTSVTDGTLLYNGTGTATTQTGLSPGQHVYYSIWGWNDTASLYSLTYQTGDATTLVPNYPPAFGTPSPTNGSTGQHKALTWSIPITDHEGNLINWNIACSNGQHSSATGASNGTKPLLISGLSYVTTYTVWVNATDPAGSGLYTREWYTFQTKADSAPDIPTTPSPSNGETNVRPTIGNLACHVTDPDGDSMNVRFYWGNGTLIGTDSSVASGGTAEVTIPTLNETRTYYWYVNVSDGILATLGPSGAPGTNWSFTTGAFAQGGGGGGLNQLSISTLFNGLPLDGAIILIYKGIGAQAANIVIQSTTGATGLKAFNLPDGTYTIHVAKQGYAEQTRTVTLVHTTALSGASVVVVFNLAQLGAVDYLMLGGTIFLLLIGLYLAYTVVKDKTYLSSSITQLIAVLLNVAVIIIGVYYFWLMAVAGAAFLIIEIIWMKWAR